MTVISVFVSICLKLFTSFCLNGTTARACSAEEKTPPLVFFAKERPELQMVPAARLWCPMEPIIFPVVG